LPDLPAPPPPVPVAKKVPIDQPLRDSAKAELAHDATSDSAILRANAIEGIQESIGTEGNDAIVAALSDHSALVRFSACMAAGTLRLPDARPALLDLVNDPDKHVQIGARFALHRLGDKRLSHDFEKYARDFDPHVRADTAMALGLLGEPSAQRVLEPMLTDAEPDVRLQVAEALWRLGDEDGLTNLAAGSVSGYADDQILCILALAAPRDHRVKGQIEGRLTAEWPEVALASARALGQLGSDQGYGVAEHFVSNPDPRVRVLAALAFGSIGRPDAQPQLTQLLKDPDPSVRVAAATAILQLKPAASQVAGG
jgi:HEAT repeat protein